MEFKEFKNLINCEGPILTLVESVDRDEMANERLYLKANCLKGKAIIYCKVNPFALEMFFQGRIAVKELFLMRADEKFIIEYNGNQDHVICDDEFIKWIINSIECANSHYYTLPQDMRVNSPFNEILHIVERDYINGQVSVLANETFGNKWLVDNGLKQ